jgi:CHASE1-domain containing sensor protein
MLSVFRYVPSALILLLGLGITLTTTVWVERWERLSRQSEFQKQTNNLTTALQRTTNRYTELLLSISDLYSAVDNDVDAGAFRRFVSRAVNDYPGIQALEWAPQITQGERLRYEQWLSTLTNSDRAMITERDEQTGQLMPAAERDRYVPVTFLEPIPSNEAALGYDLASDNTRRTALEMARDTGEIAATGRIQLVQETTENQYSFLVFVPVYQAPVSTLASRREAILGYVLGVFRVADVVEESLQNLDYDINFYVLDKTADPTEQLLGTYRTTTRKVSAEPQTIESFQNPHPCVPIRRVVCKAFNWANASGKLSLCLRMRVLSCGVRWQP